MKNYTLPLVVESLERLFDGNTTLMLQIGIYLNGDHLLSLIKHLGGLAAITRDHSFHPDVVSDFLHAVKYRVEIYRSWPTRRDFDEDLGQYGYSNLLADNFNSLAVDYKREIELNGLDAEKWQEYEMAYYRAGYMDYHMPEFLREHVSRKLQCQYLGVYKGPTSIVDFFANDIYRRRYTHLCPMGYDYHAMRFAQVKSRLEKFVPSLPLPIAEKYFSKDVYIRSGFDVDSPATLWPSADVEVTHGDPERNCCCFQPGGLQIHYKDCKLRFEKHFFSLLKRIVAAKVSNRFAEGAFFCLKAATYFEEFNISCDFRPITKLYLVDVFCHLAECLAGMSFSIDVVLFCLEAAFKRSRFNSCRLQCLSTAHNVMTSLGALQQANRLFKILEKKKLSSRNHFWFRALLKQSEGMTEYLENDLVCHMIINVFHLNCRPGPCFAADSDTFNFQCPDAHFEVDEDDDQDDGEAGEGDDHDDEGPIHAQFVRGRKLWASWRLPDCYHRTIEKLSLEIQKLAVQSVGHHATFQIIYLRVKYCLLEAGKFLCDGNFLQYRNFMNRVDVLLCEHSHLLAPTSSDCQCELHRQMVVPWYCSCDRTTDLSRAKFAALKLLLGSGFILPVKTLNDYRVRLSVLEGRVKLLANDKRDQEVMDMLFTQLVILLVQPRKDSLEFINYLLSKFDDLNEEMITVGIRSSPHYRSAIVGGVREVCSPLNPCRHFAGRGEFRQYCKETDIFSFTICCEDSVISEDYVSNLIAKKWLDKLQESTESGERYSVEAFFDKLVELCPLMKQTFCLGLYYAAHDRV
jgi:hypothetical protein